MVAYCLLMLNAFHYLRFTIHDLLVFQPFTIHDLRFTIPAVLVTNWLTPRTATHASSELVIINRSVAAKVVEAFHRVPRQDWDDLRDQCRCLLSTA